VSTPYIGEIRMASFSFPPKGWAMCDGQFLPISQNQALFSLLGTMYGGDGRINFALPDLRGRVPLHADGMHTPGERGGRESHTLTAAELPQHSHGAVAATDATSTHPDGGRWGTTTGAHYGTAAQVVMAPGLVGNVGGSQPHPNLPPFLVVSFVIALVGIFPSQN
jgi:microcystin-dependent protein